MNARDQILNRLRQAPAGSTPLPPSFAPAHPEGTPDEMWRTFQAAFEALGGRWAEVADLEGLVGRPTWLDDDAAQLLGGPRWLTVSDPWDAEVGVTTAVVAIAETGSLLLEALPGRRRLASLCPPMHVCLVPRLQIVGSLEAGLARLSKRTSVLIAGPSRTADIEGVLVRGVHGPRELWVVRV